MLMLLGPTRRLLGSLQALGPLDTHLTPTPRISTPLLLETKMLKSRHWSLFSLILFGMIMTVARSIKSKHLYIVRHGQAMHNPRAEVAQNNGCGMEEFFELMRQDDALDADLTDLGQVQAKSVVSVEQRPDHLSQVQLVVSSPLSRALQTADLVHPASECSSRVCVESWREVNGDLLNVKRRTVTELNQKFPQWNFNGITETDELWTPEMEGFDECAERGYQGLCWLMERPEECIMLVAHGGILRYTMNTHPHVKLVDQRTGSKEKPIEARFDNCELRRYTLSWEEGGDDDDDDESGGKRPIVLTQVD
jgi:broad specificity phosphatase PhoE